MALGTSTTYEISGYVPAGALEKLADELNVDNIHELLEFLWATRKEVEDHFGEDAISRSSWPFDARPVFVNLSVYIGYPDKVNRREVRP